MNAAFSENPKSVVVQDAAAADEQFAARIEGLGCVSNGSRGGVAIHDLKHCSQNGQIVFR